MATKKTKKNGLAEKSELAATRIGKQARFVGPASAHNRELFSRVVTIRAYKTSYGKAEYLVEADGNRAWVRESSLEFTPADSGETPAI